MKEEGFWNHAWFLTRVLVGLLIDIMIIAGTIVLSTATFILIWTLSLHENNMLVRVSAPLAMLAMFAAGMAGRSWMRGTYIVHVIPEALEDVKKS